MYFFKLTIKPIYTIQYGSICTDVNSLFLYASFFEFKIALGAVEKLWHLQESSNYIIARVLAIMLQMRI